MVILVISVLIAWLFGPDKNPQGTNQVVNPGMQAGESVSLILEPDNLTVSKEEEFSVDVMLNTAGQSIDGVDLFYLRFDPSVVQVVDADNQTAGVQAVSESLFGNTIANMADNTNGTIIFSQVTTGGQKYSGEGKLATVVFKAIATGSTEVAMDFEAGSTKDTNVSADGKEILTVVQGSSISIE